MKQAGDFTAPYLLIGSVALLWVKTVTVSVFGFNLTVSSLSDVILLIISPLGPLLFAAGMSFFFSRRLRPIVLLVVMTAVTFLLYGNLLYYRFYVDFITLPVLFQFSNVGGLSSSTIELLSPYDLLLFLDLFILGWVARSNRKQKFRVTRQFKSRYVLGNGVILILSLLLAFIQNPHILQASYDREQLVKSLGLYNYQFYNVVLTISTPFNKALADQSDVQEIVTRFDKGTKKHSQLFGAAEGKNVILVSLESTQDFVIDQKVNGEEVTPFLNDLIKESFYFSNIYNQTAQGKTSDAEFIVDTGLYPLASGSVFVRYPDHTFLALPRILQKKANYTTAVFHGNDPGFWNREEAYKALGYDRFFSKQDYWVTEENSVNYGIKDIPFFDQSVDKLAALPRPYFAKFITLTNHFPFLLEEKEQLIAPADTGVEVVNRYITTVRYQDEALKRFFGQLKEQEVYEDTIFLIYGDHYGISEEYEAGVHQLLGEEETVVNHVQLQQVPLIIHLPGMDGTVIETVGGQLDIRATLLHLLGIPTEAYLSFSQDLFTRGDEPVIFRDGSMVSEEFIFHDQRCYATETELQTEVGICLEHEEFARDQLTLSDRLITGDLFRFLGEDLR